jgi:hypothetical protein
LQFNKDFHKKAMLEHGDADSIIIPKMAYRPTGKTEVHISFFHSEISLDHFLKRICFFINEMV